MKYIKSYKIFESSGFPTSKEEIDEICKKYNIKNYTINDDFSIDVNDNVKLYSMDLTKLPLKFNKVSGNFSCSNNQLTSLEGCPNEVGGVFVCSSNQLTSLEGCPKNMSEFSCHNNKITSFKHCSIEPKYFHGNPVYNLYEVLSKDLKIDFEEITFRIEEFNLVNDNKIDSIKLEQLYNFYDFYKIKFNYIGYEVD